MNAGNSAPAHPDPTAAPVDPRSFDSFASFYPFYLAEHSNRTCRRLHFIGTSLTLSSATSVSSTGSSCSTSI